MKMPKWGKVGLVLISLYSCSLFAQLDDQLDVQQNIADNGATIAKIDQWQLGLAIGMGKIESAIASQEDQNLYIAPSIAYYGDKLFFDNGTLGYTLKESYHYSLSLVTEFNPHIAQYYGDHPNNIFVINSIGSSVSSPDVNFEGDELSDFVSGPMLPNSGQESRTRLKMDKPKWSVDAGVQFNWFIFERSQLIAQYFSDISGLHQGQRANLSWSQNYQFDQSATLLSGLAINLNVAIEWLDGNASQYYYGIDDRHTSYIPLQYALSSTLTPTLKLSIQKRLSQRLSFIASLKQQFLDPDLADSPIVDNGKPMTYFLGVMYAF